MQQRYESPKDITELQDNMTQPLLCDRDDNSIIDFVKPPKEEISSNNSSFHIRRLQFHSFFYGLFVGFFVEIAALAAHFMYQSVYWKERIPTARETILFSLSWAALTSIIPCVALLFLRSLLLATNSLAITATASQQQSQEQHQGEEEDDNEDDSQLEFVLWNLESRFGIGSFLGVSVAASLLDVVLGIGSHILLTVSLLAVVMSSFSFVNHRLRYSGSTISGVVRPEQEQRRQELSSCVPIFVAYHSSKSVAERDEDCSVDPASMDIAEAKTLAVLMV